MTKPTLPARLFFQSFFLFFLALPSFAQLNPDGGTGTTTDRTPSGVPVVNIARPDDKGISNNTFRDFNIGPNGLILNNSPRDGVTALGGGTLGNPNLKGGQGASLILNQVTSTNHSLLLGIAEVFGREAGVIIANPNGIICDGCGFLNAASASLFTGSLDGEGKFIPSPDGEIIVRGRGFYGNDVPLAEFVSRWQKFDGAVRDVGDLRILSGQGVWTPGEFPADDTPGSGEAVADREFSVDVTPLGKLYAGRISIVSNDSGPGVKISGDVATSVSGLYIDAAGRIVSEGTLYSESTASLTSGSGISLGRSLLAQDHVILSGESLDVSGTVASNAGYLVAEATSDVSTSLGSTISGWKGVIVKAGGRLDNAGRILSSGYTELEASDIDNRGTVYAAKTIDATADGSFSNAGLVSAGGSLLLNAGDGISNGPTGILSAGRVLSLRAGEISNWGDLYAGNLVYGESDGFVNRGSLQADGTGDSMIFSVGGFENRGRMLAQGTVSVESSGDVLNSGSGVIDAYVFAALAAGDLTNDGSISAGGAYLESGGDTFNGGSVDARSIIVDSSGDVINRGWMTASGYFKIDAVGGILNEGDGDTAGLISAGDYLEVSADHLTNSDKGLIHSGGNARLSVAGSLLNDRSGIYSGGDLIIGGGPTVETSQVEDPSADGGFVDVTYDGIGKSASVWNLGGRIQSGGNMAIFADKLVNEAGVAAKIRSPSWGPNGYHWFEYENPQLEANRGVILSLGDMTIEGGEISNKYSRIESAGDMSLSGAVLENKAYTLLASTSVPHPEPIEFEYCWDIGPFRVTCIDVVIGYWYWFSQRIYGTGKKVSSYISAGGDVYGNFSESITNAEQLSATPNTPSLRTPSAPGSSGVVRRRFDLDSPLFTVDDDRGEDGGYVIETRDAYADLSKLYGSDYFLERAGIDPATETRPLGDAMWQQHKIMEDIASVSDSPYLDDVTSPEEQMKVLLDNALEEKESLGLKVGVALTAEQINALKEDVVWYVEETHIVNGKKVTALVPRLYLSKTTRASLDPGNGAVISGRNVYLSTIGGEKRPLGDKALAIAEKGLAGLFLDADPEPGKEKPVDGDSPGSGEVTEVAGDPVGEGKSAEGLPAGSGEGSEVADNGEGSEVAGDPVGEGDSADAANAYLDAREEAILANLTEEQKAELARVVSSALSPETEARYIAARKARLDTMSNKVSSLESQISGLSVRSFMDFGNYGFTNRSPKRSSEETQDEYQRRVKKEEERRRRATEKYLAEKRRLEGLLSVARKELDDFSSRPDPDDSTKTALAEKAYLTSLVERGDVVNTGTIKARDNLTVSSNRDINNSGTMKSGGDTTLYAKRDINVRSAYGEQSFNDGEQIYGAIYRRGSVETGGNLAVVAGRDVNLTGVGLAAKGNAEINAGRNLNVTSIAVRNKRTTVEADLTAKTTTTEESIRQSLSGIKSGGGMSVTTGGSVVVAGGSFDAGGRLGVDAAGGIYSSAVYDTYSRTVEVEAYDSMDPMAMFFGGNNDSTESYSSGVAYGGSFAAGGLMTLSGDAGITLQATALKSGGKTSLVSENGAVEFRLAKNWDYYSYGEKGDSLFWNTNKSYGHNYENARLVSVDARGGLSIKAAKGFKADIVHKFDFITCKPGSKTSYCQKKRDRSIRETYGENVYDAVRDNYEVNEIKLTKFNWDNDASGLSEAAQIAITVAITSVTGGADGGLLSKYWIGAINSAGRGEGAEAAVQAGIDAATTEEALKEAVITWATMGITDYVSGGPHGQIGGYQFKSDVERILFDATVSAGLDTVVNGGELAENMVNSYKQTLIREGAKFAAGKIGKSLSNHKGPLTLDYWAHKTTHGMLGCFTAALRDGDCGSGAFGAVMGEIIAEGIGPSRLPEAEESDQFKLSDEWILNFSRIGTAFAAQEAGFNVGDSDSAATNAVQNNYLTHYQLNALDNELKECEKVKCTEAQLAEINDKYLAMSMENDAAMYACETILCVEFHAARIKKAWENIDVLGSVYGNEYNSNSLKDVNQLQARQEYSTHYIASLRTQVQNRAEEKKMQNEYAKRYCGGTFDSACDKKYYAYRDFMVKALLVTGEIVIDFTPIVGDIKGGVECVANATVLNCGGFAIGLIPFGGDIASKFFKNADKINDLRKKFVKNPPCCFVAGTPVKTEDGYKNIEALEVGDRVLSLNVLSGEFETGIVTHTYVRPVSEIKTFYRLTVGREGKIEDLFVTGEHPFWDADSKEWVTVDDIGVDAELTNPEGVRSRVLAKEALTEFRQTYNITVSGNNNYFAGKLETLVHNCNPSKTGKGTTPDGKPVDAGTAKQDGAKGGESESGEYTGGAHKDTSKPKGDGKDSHHCPAKGCYKNAPISSADGPAIKMDPADHKKTKSNGNGPIAKEYRAKQQKLLNQGKLEEAIQMDIDDIRRIEKEIGQPGKYDQAIKELKDYARTLDPNAFKSPKT